MGPPRSEADGDVVTKVAVNMGDEDLTGYSIIRGGLYGSESTPEGVVYRWTGGEASFAIPGSMKIPLTVKIRAASGRPDGLGQATLYLYCAGSHIATTRLTQVFADYEVSLPEDCLSSQGGILTIRADGWVPAQHGTSTDSRVLGFMLEELEYIPQTGSNS